MKLQSLLGCELMMTSRAFKRHGVVVMEALVVVVVVVVIRDRFGYYAIAVDEMCLRTRNIAQSLVRVVI